MAGKQGRSTGFSLVELLIVIAVIGIMSVFAMVGLGSASSSSQTHKAMSHLGGVMDFARQYAIAQNTYTYVAFNQVGDVLTTSVFASRTGRPLFESATSYPENSPKITIIAPPKEISQMTLAPDGAAYGGWTPPTPPTPATGPNRSWSITSQGRTYDAIVAFTPSGAASVTTGGSLDEVIEFGLLPLDGNGKKGFAVRVSGLTGLNRLLRP
jgi:prepilin-type N-terminal cleavage/methylation domain-containing protein